MMNRIVLQSPVSKYLARACVSLCLLVLASDVLAKQHLVRTQDEYKQTVKSLSPGDELVLANGVWTDFEIIFKGMGEKDKPITLRAQEKGKVIISGKSNLRLAGEYLVVSGLVFKNGYSPTSELIAFRTEKPSDNNKISDVVAFNSRLTEVVVDDFSKPDRYETDIWVAIYGKNNRVDHSNFQNKGNKGVLMAVRLNGEENQENHHKIDHNYFGSREILGANGGETLRIGTSHFSLTDSHTQVINNYFDKCNGEVEIISVKSGKNVVKGNVFIESRGTLTLRHGNGNIVEDNVFFGNRHDHTGGIRVINKHQRIRNNYLDGLTGLRFGGALVVMNGVPNSPINRYHQVDDAIIENNTLINSDHIQIAAGSDEERSAAPINSIFANNLIFHEEGKDTFTFFDDVSGIKFEGNKANAEISSQKIDGVKKVALKIKKNKQGIAYPKDKKLSKVGVSPDLSVIDKQSVGASWYAKRDMIPSFDEGRTIKVKPGSDTLAQAYKKAKAGDVLQLSDGVYQVNRLIEVDKPITVKGANKKGDTIVYFGAKSLFEIQNGGALKLVNLKVSGARAPDDLGNSVIRTSKVSMTKNYMVEIESCSFEDLDINKFFNVLEAHKGTFANRISIRNSTFKRISGSVLKLSRELDDYGMYNAEYIDIYKSRFEDIDGALAEVYRGGTDESTFGPHFNMTLSEVKDVGEGSKNKTGASVYLHGVQLVKISKNKFKHSAPISIEETVGEPRTYVTDNKFSATKEPSIIDFLKEKKSRK